MSETIRHKGIVRQISGEVVRVNIIAESACASCHAKGICGLADMQEKTIEIKQSHEAFHAGEEVDVVMKESLGMKALFYSYMLPFIILLTVLIVMTALGINELQAGLFSLPVLIPYYLLLFFFRKRLERVFHFSLEKLS